MGLQEVVAILFTLAATASYLNYRYLRLPNAIGLTLITLLMSLAIIILNHFDLAVNSYLNTLITPLIAAMDFNTTFMGWMLGSMLFAGGLYINVIELAKQKWLIAMLATTGVAISTFIVGILLWLVMHIIGIPFGFIYCLLFGALIAPTDPIAVLAMLRIVKAPRHIEMTIAGESLFNDGIGIVLFVIILDIATRHVAIDGQRVVIIVIEQLLGGIMLGGILGLITSFLLRKVDNFSVGVLITLALVTGGYIIAVKLDASGPITMAMAGLLVGARLRRGRLSLKTARQLQEFWELLDELLTTMLFVMIGLEVFELKQFTIDGFWIAFLAIPITLLARFISVSLPLGLFAMFRYYNRYAIRLLTWGGLRGGISIALALSLPHSVVAKEEILIATYSVVVFSIIVQGLSIGPMIKRFF